jgi:cytochrome P450
VPKQTVVMTSSYVNARLEKFFTNDCYEFKPERFIKNIDSNDSL